MYRDVKLSRFDPKIFILITEYESCDSSRYSISTLRICRSILGYGHISPSTTTGRAITIVYAIFGIPMFLIILADFGKLFTRGIKFLWAFVRRVYYTGSCRKVRRTVPVQVRSQNHRERSSCDFGSYSFYFHPKRKSNFPLLTTLCCIF